MATAPIKKTAKQLQAEIDAANLAAAEAKAQLAQLEALTKLCEKFKQDVESANFTLQDAIAELDPNYTFTPTESKPKRKKPSAAKSQSKWGSLEKNTTYVDPEDKKRSHTTKGAVRRIPKLLTELAEKYQKPYSHFKQQA